MQHNVDVENANEEVIVKEFRKLDQDGTGLIRKEELREVFVSLGCSKEDATSVVDVVDSDADGNISYEELMTWIFDSETAAWVSGFRQSQARTTSSSFNVVGNKTPGPRWCKNGCGHTAAPGYSTCCKTCTQTKGRMHGPVCRERAKRDKVLTVQPAEWRGITVKQLQQVRAEVADRCVAERWLDWEGTLLQPEEVNLYELNKYVILPQTVPDGVLVTGIKCKTKFLGCVIQQCSTGAKGIVTSVDEAESSMQVCVQVGRFDTPKSDSPCDIRVDSHEIIPTGKVSVQAARHSSFVGLLTYSPQKPVWFVSHWWGEPVFDFVKVIEHHAHVRNLEENTPYWVCAYANDQHSLEEDVTSDPRDSSFFRALSSKQCNGVLLVLNSALDEGRVPAAMPFNRIWCAFEIHQALAGDKNLLLDIATTHAGKAQLLTEGLSVAEAQREDSCRGHGFALKVKREREFPIAILQAGISVVLESAQASVEADRRRILNVLIGSEDLESSPPLEHERLEMANRRLRGIFALAAWPRACEDGVIDSMRLPETLAADVERRELHVCLAKLVKDDTALEALSHGFPPRLQSIVLDLSGTELSDHGLKILAQGFEGLTDLATVMLDCNGTRIGDEGVAGLASSFAKCGAIENINFHFRESSLGDIALAALGSLLPELRHLRQFSLSCAKCPVTDEGLIHLGAGLLQVTQLEALKLNLAGCTEIHDRGVEALGLHGLKQLRRVNITLTQTSVGRQYWKLWEIRKLRKLFPPR